MKLQNKFFIAHLPIIIIIVVMSINFYFVMQQITQNSKEILSVHYSKIINLEELQHTLEDINHLISSYNLYKKEHIFISYNSKKKESLQYFSNKNHKTHTFEENDLKNSLRHNINMYFAHIDDILKTQDNKIEQIRLLNQLFQDIKLQIKKLIELDQNEMFFRIDYVDKINSQLSVIIIIVTLLLFLLSSITSSFMTNKILLSLNKVNKFIKEISTGNFNTSLSTKGNDEIAEISKELNHFKAKIKDLYLTSENKFFQTEIYLSKLLDILVNTTFIIDAKTGEIIYYNHSLFKFMDKDNLVTDRNNYTFDNLIPELSFTLHDFIKKSEHEKEIARENTHLRIKIKSVEDIDELVLFIFPIYNQSLNINSFLVRIHGFSNSLDNKINEMLYINHNIKQYLDDAMTSIHCCLEGTLGEISKKQYEYLYQARETIFTVINEFSLLIDWVAIEQKVNYKVLNLDDLIKKVISNLLMVTQMKDIKISLKNTPVDTSIYSNDELLFLAIKNIVFKLISLTHEKDEILISYIDNKRNVKLTISAAKLFLSKKQIEDIYNKYNPLAIDTYDKLGLSFYIAVKLYQKLEHKFNFISDKNSGTTFTVEIPKKKKHKQTTSK